MASVRVTFAWTLCKQPASCEERIARASLRSHRARLAGVFTRAACRTLSAPFEATGRLRWVEGVPHNLLTGVHIGTAKEMAHVQNSAIHATNGVVHVIDKVLMP